MRPLTSQIISRLGPLGLYACARQLSRNHPRILMYHRFSKVPKPGFVSREQLRWQLGYIQRYFNPMTLKDLTRAVHEHGHVPKHAIIVTIDDGYRDFYEVAWPVFREVGVPATLFATTGFVNGDLWLWPDKVRWLLNQTRCIPEVLTCGPITLEVGELNEETRNEYWARLIEFFLSIPDDEKHALINSLAGKLDVEIPDTAPEPFAAVTWHHLREMQESGLEVGGHTVTHPSLGRVSEERAREEISGCRDELKKTLNIAPYSFCYPNGQPSDYSADIGRIVETAGFSNAVVAFPDYNGVFRRFEMRRHSAKDKPFQFLKAVNGVESIAYRMKAFRHSIADG